MLRERRNKITALFFLIIFSAELFLPVTAHALTSGPAQPEMAKFAPAGATDLVDLFTGDLKYNIPLLDVGGYPINLSYNSGTGIEDEASWVGTGWTLNPGAVNRTMRGLPDDFDGSKGIDADRIEKKYFKKDFIKAGGQIVLKPSFLAFEMGKASLKVNVYKDNYYGVGASVGASLGFNLSKITQTPLTAGLNLDVNSDTRDGVDLNPSFSLSRAYDMMEEESTKWSLGGGFNYNTRAGLKSISLEASYNTLKDANTLPPNIERSAVKYFGQSYTPTITTNTENKGHTFSFDFGPSFFGGYLGVGGAGYVYEEKNIEPNVSIPAFGYMNYLKGRKNENALLDFNREKDGVYLTSAPAIPVPVATQDLFTASGQTGSQQFRPYFGGNYIVFDRMHSNTSFNAKAGVTIGGGNIFQGGARLDFTNGGSRTKKWVQNNNYLVAGEPSFGTGPLEEPVYFKQVGEHSKADNAFNNDIIGKETEKISLNGSISSAAYQSRGGTRSALPVKKTAREIRNYGFSYLTAEQAEKYALDKKIKSYSVATINNEAKLVASLNNRATPDRKKHHISEITVTDNEGKRMIYGIPVYNISQEEVSFAINPSTISNPSLAKQTGLVKFVTRDLNGNITKRDDRPNNKNGRDELYTKEKMPAYATSYLLSGVLSPDYVDLTGDGISDDDLGTAAKFNYQKITSENNYYQWRAPYEMDMANYNEGFQNDGKDDRANYVYGQKEIWYLQSIESKTVIAVFETSEREDGLGVLGSTGGKNSSMKLKKLDKIKLYSKADFFIKNSNGETIINSNAVPVKTVHLEYDYTICPGVPNNTGEAVDKNGDDPAQSQLPDVNIAKGKLTLKKVYFTFGNNQRGASNPYEFEYDLRPINDNITNLPKPPNNEPHPYGLEGNDKYTTRQTDRWGTYKQSWYNRSVTQQVLNNSEFPYALQKNGPPAGVDAVDWANLIDKFASKWQLNKITTPTGSVITAEYESDDYAFVQNKRAMQMCFLKGIQTEGQSSGLINANKLVVALPKPVTGTADFKNKYLKQSDGSFLDKIFYKVNADIDNRDHYEYVHGYAELDINAITAEGSTAILPLKPLKGKNAIAKGAWQMLQTDLPQFAYDNYDNSDVSGDFKAIIQSILGSIGNLREIGQSFDEKAKKRTFADKVDLSKSMIRLCNPDDKKTGGGSRVKKIQISDEWNEMSGVANSKTAKYGQKYEYSISDKDGNIKSSGVAAYEPQTGNEENPFHEPVNFTERVHWSSDRYHFMEKPFCETYFPAAQVGYSKVTVISTGDDYANGAVLDKHTGHIENEFYTARDFPTIVDNLTLSPNINESSLILKLFSSVSYKNVSTSQGFKVELNDMHGKTKSVSVFDKKGDRISSTEYTYNVKDDDNTEFKELNNELPVLKRDGTIENNTTLATDVDFVTDARESRSESIGTSIGAYKGVLAIGFWVTPFGRISHNSSVTSDSYHSVSAVKVIHRFGIIKKVRTMQNGSNIEAENLLWDGETGEVLLTKTQNEFDKHTYSFTYPAYMAYEGMAGAYKNLGAVFTNMQVETNGNVNSYLTYLFPGDELIDLLGNRKVWVIKGGDGLLHIIDEKGDFVNISSTYQILRSGRRNILGAGSGSVVCMKDPRVNGRIDVGVDKRILDSKAAIFTEKWAVPVGNSFTSLDCPEEGLAGRSVSSEDNVINDTIINYQVTTTQANSANRVSSLSSSSSQSCSCICLKGLFDYLIHTDQLFIQQSQNITVGQLITQANTAGYNIGSCGILNMNINKLFYAVTENPVSTIYTAKVGGCTVSIRSNNTEPVSFYELTSQPCTSNSTVSYAGPAPQTFSATYSTACTKNYTPTGMSNPSYKLVSATSSDGFSEAATQFDIPGISQIPSNAIINSASFYVYAAPEGYFPPSFPNAHSTKAGQYVQFDRIAWRPRNCDEMYFSGIHNQASYAITNSFQDCIIDFKYLVQDIVSLQQNHGFWMLDVAPNGTFGRYITFASENHPNPSKRPKLEVTYTIPSGTSGNLATLEIDECNPCSDPVGDKINPYFTGLLGNWRPWVSYVYTVKREQKPGNPNQIGGTDIRNSGYYTTYNPFWTFTSTGLINSIPAGSTTLEPADNRWVWSNKSVYYDQKGNEIESVDALNRYGSALFGYQQSLAVAVGANARHNEIAFDGFEDYDFSLVTTPEPCPLASHFDFGFTKQSGEWQSASGKIVNISSHTGKYSYQISSNVSITKAAGAASPTNPFLDYDNTGRYKLLANELVKGFAPVAGKKYLVSFWVNDHDLSQSTNTIQGLEVKINDQPQNVSSIIVPVVEGWKRLDLTFTAGADFKLELIPSGTKEIDDFRILPNDGQLGSYVYDDRTLRLTAQLDENNFATFYEYDDEGTPIRVKKETERGIMTLKENRQSFRKR